MKNDYCQLLEWLRKEFQINVYCRIMENQWEVYMEYIHSGVDITPHSLMCIDFTSYESAIEAGIQAAMYI
jgi:hypothetical protein